MNNDILLNRKIINWGWYTNANTFRVFIHLLLLANWKDGDFQGYQILRGQCLFGRKSFAENLEISEQSIRTSINHLKSTHEITIKSTNKFSIITIVKYNDYQQFTNTINQQITEKSTCDQPTTNQQLTTSKEGKEGKANKEDNITPLPPKGNERFLEFWKAYPKKIGKGAAEEKFKKFKPSQELLTLMLDAISKQIKFDPQWQKDNGQFIPNPATWLNQKRWEDEIIAEHGRDNGKYEIKADGNKYDKWGNPIL